MPPASLSAPRSSRARTSARSGASDGQDGAVGKAVHDAGNRSTRNENGFAGPATDNGGRDAIQPGVDSFFKKKKNRDAPTPSVFSADSVNGSGKETRATNSSEGISTSNVKSSESRAAKVNKGIDRDDIDQGAQLLLGFAQATCEGSPVPTDGSAEAAVRDANENDENGMNVVDHDKSGILLANGTNGAVPIDEDWAWEPSCHDGLLTFHDGRKRWYHCMYCPYFNDRLYHSKMHFERIHVKQGKSMPRKRKYMDPAGSKAGEAAALPPSTQKQPEPKYSRVRRPGDKWLKTVTDAGSHAGFRYQSVYDRKRCPSRSSSPLSDHDADPGSDEGLMNTNDIHHRSLILSPASKFLYCWESPAAIQRGAERGDFVKAWKPVYTFKSEIGPASSAAAHRPEREIPVAADPILPPAAKRWQWWWYKPPGTSCGAEESGSEAAAKSISAGEMQSMTDAEGVLFSSQSTVDESGQFAGGDGSSADSHSSGVQSAASVLGNGIGASSNMNSNMSTSPRLITDAASAPIGFRVLPPGCIVRNPVRGRGMGGSDSAAGRAKRVWRRWDPNEENALREAVDHLGTKDWAAIHERMRTDRSIKQLQDHWNDTKKERVPPVGPAGR